MKSNEAAPGGGLSRGTPRTILTYHAIGPNPSRYLYSATCQQFEAHMAFLAGNAAEGNTANGLAQVTFDDGQTTDHENALPILEKCGIRATFFVTAGLVEHEAGFMSWEQVRELAARGHSVESHGWSHMLLDRADARELQEELVWSKQELEDRLGSTIESISLPGGRWTPRVLEACAEAGYRKVYHSNPWIQPEHTSGVEFLGRFMMRNSMDAARLRSFLEGKRSTVLYLRAQHRAKEMGKQLIGDQLYHRLWQMAAKLAGQEHSQSEWDRVRPIRSGPR